MNYVTNRKTMQHYHDLITDCPHKSLRGPVQPNDYTIAQWFVTHDNGLIVKLETPIMFYGNGGRMNSDMILKQDSWELGLSFYCGDKSEYIYRIEDNELKPIMIYLAEFITGEWENPNEHFGFKYTPCAEGMEPNGYNMMQEIT